MNHFCHHRPDCLLICESNASLSTNNSLSRKQFNHHAINASDKASGGNVSPAPCASAGSGKRGATGEDWSYRGSVRIATIPHLLLGSALDGGRGGGQLRGQRQGTHRLLRLVPQAPQGFPMLRVRRDGRPVCLAGHLHAVHVPFGRPLWCERTQALARTSSPRIALGRADKLGNTCRCRMETSPLSLH